MRKRSRLNKIAKLRLIIASAILALILTPGVIGLISDNKKLWEPYPYIGLAIGIIVLLVVSAFIFLFGIWGPILFVFTGDKECLFVYTEIYKWMKNRTKKGKCQKKN